MTRRCQSCGFVVWTTFDHGLCRYCAFPSVGPPSTAPWDGKWLLDRLLAQQPTPAAIMEVGPVVTLADHRAALVRAVLGQQWAAFVAFHNSTYSLSRREPNGDLHLEREMQFGLFIEPHIYDSRCADDVVAEMLGEPTPRASTEPGMP